MNGQHRQVSHPLWVAAVFVLIGCAEAGGDKDDGEGKTLCQVIADSKTDLRPSDYRDLAGYTQGQLEAHVRANCPDLAFYVLD